MIESEDWWPDQATVHDIACEYAFKNASSLAEVIKDARDVWAYRSKLQEPEIAPLRTFNAAMDSLAKARSSLNDDHIRLRVAFTDPPGDENQDARELRMNRIDDAFDRASDALDEVIRLSAGALAPRTAGQRRHWPHVRAAQLLFDHWKSTRASPATNRNIAAAILTRSSAMHGGSNPSHAALFIERCMNTFTNISASQIGEWDLDHAPELLRDLVAIQVMPTN